MKPYRPNHLLLITICTLAMWLPLHGQAGGLPLHNPVPGGIAVIPLTAQSAQPPRIFYNEKPVMALRDGQHWHAIVGIPLSAAAGEHAIRSETTQGSRDYTFTVNDKAYETQHLTIKNKRKVNPNEEDMKRIRAESARIRAALSHWDDTLYADSVLLELPAQGRLSSPFGLRRFFNEQPRRPHSGIDIAAPQGTPIIAPAAGKVILTGDFFFNGNSVFLDHGQGLVTMYAHMDRIDVKEGDLVKRGQQLGTMGMTGRVTGPHLHWGVSLNDARVDPHLLVPALQPSLAGGEPDATM